MEYQTFDTTNKDYDIDEQCCLCGKDVKGANLYVHTYGGGEIIHPKDDGINNDGAYTGLYRIGSTCAGKLPKEYIIKFDS